MSSTQESTKRISVKGVMFIVLAALAGGGGLYAYFTLTKPSPKFTMSVTPFFHAAPGGGGLMIVQVSRTTDFTADIDVSLLNPPAWLTVQPIALNSTTPNGTLIVQVSEQATLGSYRLTVSGTAQGSPDQMTTTSMKIVSVHRVTSPYGSALVYNTTKVLDAQTLAALVSFNNGTFQFSQSTTQLDSLELGDVIGATSHVTPILPHGFLRTVLAVQTDSGGVSVITRPAGLLEAAQSIQFSFGNTTSASGAATSSIGVMSTGPQDATEICNAAHFGCTNLLNQQITPDGFPVSLCNNCDAKFTLGATLVIDIGGGGSISCCISVDWFALLLIAHEDATASITGSAGSVFTWNPGPFQQIGGFDFPIIPGIVDLSVTLSLAGHSSGTLLENVDTGVHQTFDMVVGAVDNTNNAPSVIQKYCGGAGANGLGLCTFSAPGFIKTINISPPVYPGSEGTARVELGPRLDISASGGIGVAGVSGDAYGEADVFWELDTVPKGVPIWTLYLGIDLRFGVGIYAWVNWCVFDCSSHYTIVGNDWGPFDIRKTTIAAASPLQLPTPVLIISNSANTLDFSSLGLFPPGPISGWGALMGADPNGEAVTCLWMAKEFGQIATTMATGHSGLACPGPTYANLPISQIISKDLTELTVYVVAQDTTGAQSNPSNSVTVKVKLPLPQLYIEAPQNSTTLTEGTPFDAFGRATLATVVSSTNPNGIIDLCQSEPQNLAWYVGGIFEADQVDIGPGGSGGGGAWVGAVATGSGCVAPITIPSSGQTSLYQTTIYFVLGAVDPETGNWYIPQASEGTYGGGPGTPVSSNVAAATVNVQPTTAPPGVVTTASIAAPTVQITSPSSGSSYAYLQSVPLQGTAAGGTPPYTTATWTAQSGPYSYTIASGPASSTLSYQWAFGPSSGCSALDVSTNTPVVISLSVTDSAGQTGTSPSSPPFTIYLSCEVAQVIQPIPVPPLVSLLSVLFAVTAERVIVSYERSRLSCRANSL